MTSKFLALSVIALAGVGLTACSTDSQTDSAPANTSAAGENAACSYPETGRGAAKKVEKPGAADNKNATVTLETNAGDIVMNLDASKAPCTVNAITSLAEQGYYDNTICHRLTTDGIFVLQCGDPTGKGSGGPGFSFADEYPVTTGEKGVYKAGTIAMANAGKSTNGSQFFLNYEESPLPPMYTMFGTMDDASLQVVRDIAAKGTANGAGDGAPKEEVKIEKATVK